MNAADYIKKVTDAQADEKTKADAAANADKAFADAQDATHSAQDTLKTKLAPRKNPILVKQPDGSFVTYTPDQSQLGYHIVPVDSEDTDLDGGAAPAPAPAPEPAPAPAPEPSPAPAPTPAPEPAPPGPNFPKELGLDGLPL